MSALDIIDPSKLEFMEVKLSEVRSSASTFRLDAEYFQKLHISDTEFVNSHLGKFRSFSERSISIDASAFYPSIRGFYGTGNLPFLRVADVTGLIDYEGSEVIPESIAAENASSLKTAVPGDIVLTKGGSIARAGLITRNSAASRDLIILRTSSLPVDERIFIFLYVQTEFFKRVLVRSSSQTAQPHLTNTLVQHLPVYMASKELREATALLVSEAFRLREESLRLLADSRRLVLEKLQASEWAPNPQLGFIRKSSDVFAHGRIDAEYFHPRHTQLHDLIARTGKLFRLGDLLDRCERGQTPNYADAAESESLPVINSKHVRSGNVLIDSRNRRAIPKTGRNGLSILAKDGDVLLNGTGVGTIGRCSAFRGEIEAVPDNHVTVLRLSDNSNLDPEFLAAQLNSLVGKMQVEQRLSGSSGQIELYPDDIREFKIWVPDKEVQKSISSLVIRSAEYNSQSGILIRKAIEATEAAFKTSDAEALQLALREPTSY